jgi:hypothetical protein
LAGSIFAAEEGPRNNSHMSHTNTIDNRRLKQALKEVVREKLRRNPRWLREVVAEVLEDMALSEAIRRGRASKLVSRDKVFRTLEDDS